MPKSGRYRGTCISFANFGQGKHILSAQTNVKPCARTVVVCGAGEKPDPRRKLVLFCRDFLGVAAPASKKSKQYVYNAYKLWQLEATSKRGKFDGASRQRRRIKGNQGAQAKCPELRCRGL